MTYFRRKFLASSSSPRAQRVARSPACSLSPTASSLFEETHLPSVANTVLFLIAPMITFLTALIAWAVVAVRRRLGIRRTSMSASLSFRHSRAQRLGISIAGGARTSKYRLPGRLRCGRNQMVSYEVPRSASC